MGLREWNARQLEAAQRREAEIRARKEGARGDGTSIRGYVDEHESEIVARFGSLYLFPDRIIKLPYTGWTVPLDHPMRALTPEEQPIAGVSAVVEETGGVAARGTLTRSVLVGGWQKKLDTRGTHIVIDGPGFQWQISLGGGEFGSAPRDFAAKVTTAGRLDA